MCITISLMKSKFIYLDKDEEEAEWLQDFLEDISCWPKLVLAIYVHCDNQFILEEYKVVYISVNLDIYVVNIIPLKTCSHMKLYLLTM
jgi:hypothetical protein